MSQGLPEPLTPADCDLRGLPFMPLHGDRLIDSDLFYESTGDEFKAAVALWWASWKQVPAASLPDNPRVLAGLARVPDARKWAKLSPRVMHGWIKCADGRLYHSVVASLAREAWEDRQEHRAGRDADKERKQAEREERRRMFADLKAAGVHLAWNTAMPDLRAKHAASCPAPVQNLSSGQVSDRPAPVTAIEGTGTGTGTGTSKEESVASAPPTTTGSKLPGDGFEALWSAALPTMRKRAKSRAKVQPEWLKAIAVAPASRIVAGLTDYLANDPDIGRTGGPGLHIWLKDRTWESWGEGRTIVDASAWTEAQWALAVEVWRKDRDWSSELGPRPGEPGCRVPSSLLIGPASGAAA